MALTFIRKPKYVTSLMNSYLLPSLSNLCSKTKHATTKAPANYSTSNALPPLFSTEKECFNSFHIDLVDDDTWELQSGLTHLRQGFFNTESTEKQSAAEKAFDEQANDVTSLQDDSDFDEIDNMKIRGNLFYKLDRNSKEFEEYSFDFHRKKSSKKNDNNAKEGKKEEHKKPEKLLSLVKNDKVYSVQLNNMDPASLKKKVRIPTFNQLTAPYHLPFCLDIYISKASVRACIVHRVTSKVVAVAHSISKDLKFDLSSTKNKDTCAAVGAILAQRALADDIHNVVYTPRKGEKLEGKLQIVLQSIIDSGINVKVKLKQRKHHKARIPSMSSS